MLDFPSPNQGCLACHQGIEPIREHDSKMMIEIYSEGEKEGDPNGCVVCHYGNSFEEKDKSFAHKDIDILQRVWLFQTSDQYFRVYQEDFVQDILD